MYMHLCVTKEEWSLPRNVVFFTCASVRFRIATVCLVVLARTLHAPRVFIYIRECRYPYPGPKLLDATIP